MKSVFYMVDEETDEVVGTITVEGSLGNSSFKKGLIDMINLLSENAKPIKITNTSEQSIKEVRE